MINYNETYHYKSFPNSIIFTFPNKDKLGTLIATKDIAEKYVIEMCRIVGGSSLFFEYGNYLTDTNQRITEFNRKIKVYFNIAQRSHIKKLIYNYCKTLFYDMNQESAAIELNNEFSTIYKINEQNNSIEISNIIDRIFDNANLKK